VVVSNGHHKHEKLFVGRNSLCCVATKLAPADRGEAKIFGVGLRMMFPRKSTFLIYYPKI
jgi:hypothetical protein